MSDINVLVIILAPVSIPSSCMLCFARGRHSRVDGKTSFWTLILCQYAHKHFSGVFAALSGRPTREEFVSNKAIVCSLSCQATNGKEGSCESI